LILITKFDILYTILNKKSTMSNTNEIAILDFGSQYTHLIARRIRELGVISRIYPNDTPASKLKNAVGIILSGGPKSLVNDPKIPYDKNLFDLDIPVLGLCYGHYLVTDYFGGTLGTGKSREYGIAKMNTSDSPIFKDTAKELNVWMSHGDHVEKLPNGFKQIASTENGSITAMHNLEKQVYGFQFHPEVNHTNFGKKMIENFVFNICESEKNWDTGAQLEQIQKEIKEQAGDKNVFLLISGGVDSTVCFALLEKTLGKSRVYGLHVDHGMMRENESDLVVESLKQIGLDDLHVYNAEDEYLEKLKNKFEPEEKRKIIGDLFLSITDKIMAENQMNSNEWLIGQGTIYPDTIESGGTKNADVIKTHHNRVPKIQEMIKEGKIIEPIKDLYKDEVRAIGEKLGLPRELLYRHPFPGPGLGIRCLCSDGQNNTSTVILKNVIPNTPPVIPTEVEGSLKDIYKLPIKSVGVQGDERSYEHPAVITEEKTWEELKTLSTAITNSNRDINRVLYLLSGKKEDLEKSIVNKAYITKDRLETLRKIDEIVNKHILNNELCSHIWQMPVVLIPYGYDKKESIVLRPVESEEAMTVNFAEIPKQILDKIVKEIEDLKLVDFIFFDLTNKPPGTIEWE